MTGQKETAPIHLEPWYLQYGEKVGISLANETEVLQKSHIPPSLPLSAVLDTTRNVVHGVWEHIMLDSFKENEFLSNIGPRSRAFIAASQNDGTLVDMVKHDQYGFLQTLRSFGEPDCWKAVVAALSQREQMNARLTHELIQNTPDEYFNKQDFSKKEMLLFTDLSAVLQHPVDQAYIKQMTIFETEGPKKENPPQEREKFGSGYFYIFPDNEGGVDRAHPYSEMFPNEIGGIARVFNSFADRIQAEAAVGELAPERYLPLVPYLKEMAKAILSKNTNYSKTNSQWEKISKLSAQIAKNGCPLMINPWGFWGEGGHVDVEFLVGLQHSSYPDWEKNAEAMSQSLSNFASKLKLKSPMVPTIFLQMLSISGSNHAFTSTAATGDGYIGFNDAQNLKIGSQLYEKHYARILDGDTNKDRFIHMRGLITIAHELGHLLRMNKKHLGEGLSQSKLEELKADTLGALYFSTSGKRSESEYREYIEHYIIDYIDDIQRSRTSESVMAKVDNSASSLYAFSGLSILTALFESKSIKMEGGKVIISDARKGVEVMSKLGEIIVKKYGKQSFDSDAINHEVALLEDKIAHNDDIKKFLSLLE